MRPQKIDLFSPQNDIPEIFGVQRFTLRFIAHFNKLLNQNGGLNTKYQQCQQANGNSCADCSRKEYHKYHNYGIRLAPDYSCREKTLIYAIRSMLCHAEEIMRGLMGFCFMFTSSEPPSSVSENTKSDGGNPSLDKIKIIRAVEYLLAQEKIKVVSIGYGSGADLLGLLYFFTFFHLHHSTLDILRIDKYMQHWDFSAQETELFIRQNANIPFKFSVEKEDNDQMFQNFSGQSQLFTLSYVLNELNDEEMEQIAEKIKTLAANRFWILINERAYNEHTEARSLHQIKKFAQDTLHNTGCCEINHIGGRINGRDSDNGGFLKNLLNSQHNEAKQYIRSVQQEYQMKIYADSVYYLGEFTR